MFTTDQISAFKNIKTPFYFYDTELLRQTVKKVSEAAAPYNFHVHYALKANAEREILQIIQKQGFGADCVSGNEVKRALETGFPSEKILFAGVGKSDEEILLGLDAGIGAFNVESIPEMQVINALAHSRNTIARIAVRLNPNIDARTHHYITTGLEENKFGINMSDLEKLPELLKSLKNLQLIGLHLHIGSQITDLDVFKSLCIRVNKIQDWFISNRILLKTINVGGGLGVDYKNPDNTDFPDFKAYFKLFHQFLDLRAGQSLHFELGRAIVAQCGSLITKVLYIKHGQTTNFAVVDAGMTDLIRPALYQAYHKIENISSSGETEFYDVVGPICESSDVFGKTVSLPPTQRGDLLAIRTAGAYGQVMASQYNLRNLVSAIYSEDLSKS